MFPEQKSGHRLSSSKITRRQSRPCCSQQAKSELVRSTVVISSAIIHLCTNDASFRFVIGRSMLLRGRMPLSLLLEKICHAMHLGKYPKISITLLCFVIDNRFRHRVIQFRDVTIKIIFYPSIKKLYFNIIHCKLKLCRVFGNKHLM